MDDAAAAINLVGSVVRLVPAIKNATRNVSVPGARGLGSGGTPTTTVHPAPPRVDPERERRAYETVNFVLRTLGSRIGEAGMVSIPSLAKALTEATQSIDVKLFSIETNRLFESLASKLNDPVLVNSVFTSIYLISFLTAELQGSLPNYKDTYTPLGPKLVQQLFMAAIGSDAFRENQTANLDAYQTLARTAGLLRPTDLERATFPGFPSFRPCRYSSKTFKDTRNHRMAYEKLVKHFETYGFPQPVKNRDVGMIRDWRFLSGDSNTRAFEVEKADKQIGENFGRVLHWLICSADRMPPGEAVIAYLDQHIELIKWMGSRMGYRAISAATGLNMSGPHATLKKELREIFNTWVVLMPSENAKASRRQSSAQWAQALQRPMPSQQSSYTSSAQRTPSIGTPVSPVDSNVSSMLNIQRTPSAGTPISPIGSNVPPMPSVQRKTSTRTPISPIGHGSPRIPATRLDSMPSTCQSPTIEEETGAIRMRTSTSSISTPASPQSGLGTTSPDATKALPPGTTTSQGIQLLMKSPSAQPLPTVPVQLPTSSDISKPFIRSQSTSPVTSPPPYSPSPIDAYPLPSPHPASVIRRKAPPRPKKKLVLAKALYDFEPEDDNDEELPFREGDILEIVEKSAALDEEGWCRARLKNGTRIGLAPLEYLEELGPEAQQALETKPTKLAQTSTPSSPPITSLGPVPEQIHELSAQNPPWTPNPGLSESSSSVTNVQAPSIGQQDTSATAEAPNAPVSSAQGGSNHTAVPGVGHTSASFLQAGSPTLSVVSDSGIARKLAGAVLSHAAFQHPTGRPTPASTHGISHQTARPNLVNVPTQSAPQTGIGAAPTRLASSQSFNARPPVGRPARHAAHSSQIAANLLGAIQNASTSQPVAAGTTVNLSNQTMNGPPMGSGYPSQTYGAPYVGPQTANSGSAYPNMTSVSGYPMAPQPPYAYAMNQPMYNNNGSGDDALMQMLAMQTVAGIAQPSTAPPGSFPAMDTSTYNDPTSNSYAGNITDPGLNSSGTPASTFGGQEEIDTSSTDPSLNPATDSATDPTTDLNNLPLSTPTIDPSDPSLPPATEMSPPLADVSGFYTPPDPSTIILSNPAADITATDPPYSSMNPDMTPVNISIDQDQGMTSPLASLSPMPPPSFDPSTGADPTLNPLAGLASAPDAGMTSPLAGLMQETDGSNAALASIDGTVTEEVEAQQTTVVTQDTTVVDDAGTETDEQFADDQVGYVMDASDCPEDWDV